MSGFKFSQRSLDRMEGVDERLLRIAALAIEITKYDFGIPRDAGIRTPERQKELFDKGASLCDGVIKKSRHQSGKALDFYAYVDGQASWDRHHLAMIAAAFLQAASILNIPLQWGGLWRTFEDSPHMELLDD